MKYFTFEELCNSSTARKMGLTNYPQTEELFANMRALVDNVLDPARETLGAPILVDSGYRCPKVNQAVGGVKNSAHMRGCAADIYCKSELMDKLWDILKSMEFDQLIKYTKKNFYHVSFETSKPNRRQILYM